MYSLFLIMDNHYISNYESIIFERTLTLTLALSNPEGLTFKGYTRK